MFFLSSGYIHIEKVRRIKNKISNHFGYKMLHQRKKCKYYAFFKIKKWWIHKFS